MLITLPCFLYTGVGKFLLISLRNRRWKNRPRSVKGNTTVSLVAINGNVNIAFCLLYTFTHDSLFSLFRVTKKDCQQFLRINGNLIHLIHFVVYFSQISLNLFMSFFTPGHTINIAKIKMTITVIHAVMNG